ncbi:MAG: monovalent cation/H(+) antiporter subunit G [Rhodocyclaceae bacterium]|nr:monovalent cation/H(+) antiporter subunit G [Rhodocyclaceae bacterium]
MIGIDILTWFLVSAGGVFCVIGAVGMLRMPDFFTRMHAASVIDTLGAGLIIAGLILQSGFTLASLKLLILGLLIFFTSPTASHALASAALERGAEPILADEEGESSSSPR